MPRRLTGKQPVAADEQGGGAAGQGEPVAQLRATAGEALGQAAQAGREQGHRGHRGQRVGGEVDGQPTETSDGQRW